jgi:hypothetical protein
LPPLRAATNRECLRRLQSGACRALARGVNRGSSERRASAVRRAGSGLHVNGNEHTSREVRPSAEGRLLRPAAARPLLYLSVYLKKHRAQYYDRLQAVRIDGDWEGWILFFLRGVLDVAEAAHETAKRILALRQQHQQKLHREKKSSTNLLRALELLFEQPIQTAAGLADKLDVSYPTANGLLSRLQELQILEESTGFRRNRKFAHEPYLRLFDSTASDQEAPVS